MCDLRVSVYVCVHTLYIIKSSHFRCWVGGEGWKRGGEKVCLFYKEKVVYSSAPSNVLTKCLLNLLLYFKNVICISYL